MTKTYALSKTKVRELIESKFNPEDTVKVQDILDLFESGRSGGTSSTLVFNDDGEVIAKRCSYFGVFMPIDEFGKRGDVYSYQSKLAESLVRKANSLAITAKKLADEELADEVIDVSSWKEKLSEIEKMKEAKVAITDVEDAPQYFETAEEAQKAL